MLRDGDPRGARSNLDQLLVRAPTVVRGSRASRAAAVSVAPVAAISATGAPGGWELILWTSRPGYRHRRRGTRHQLRASRECQ